MHVDRPSKNTNTLPRRNGRQRKQRIYSGNWQINFRVRSRRILYDKITSTSLTLRAGPTVALSRTQAKALESSSVSSHRPVIYQSTYQRGVQMMGYTSTLKELYTKRHGQQRSNTAWGRHHNKQFVQTSQEVDTALSRAPNQAHTSYKKNVRHGLQSKTLYPCP